MIIRKNVPLSELTTMRLGGPARFLIEIESASEAAEAHEFAIAHNLPYYILGGGANTIAKDEGFNGAIIRNIMTGIIAGRVTDLEGVPRSTQRVEPWEGKVGQDPLHIITVLGGTEWDDVVAYACNHNLTGIEALSKIPGLAGAAPVQNIGAYGQEIADTFISAEAYDFKRRTYCTLDKHDFGFAYRKSILNTTEKQRYLILSITLSLREGEMPRPFYNSIESYIKDHHETDFTPQNIRKIVSTIRADKLPDPTTTPSAGSFFKNIYLTPKEAEKAEAEGIPVHHGHDGLKINSGWLIEQAGLKGKLLHGFRISDKAALVLINESASSYQDLVAARTEIIDTVQAKFGFKLSQEPMELPL